MERVSIPRSPLGSDGYDCSALIVGGWQLSVGHREAVVDEADLFEALARMVRAGMTTFDCADIYTGVEERFGRFLAAHGSSLQAEGCPVQIHTKYVPDFDQLSRLDKESVERVIDRSLQRLGVERLDLVQFSWWDYGVPGYVEAARWLTELRAAGKIRHVGATNFDAVRMAEMLDAGVPLVSNQVQYSLLDRRPEQHMVPLAERHQFSLLCYGALAGGFLADRFLEQSPPEVPANRSQRKYRVIIEEVGGWTVYQRLLQALRTIADRHQVPIASVALRFAMDRPRVAGVMVGTFHGKHLESTLAAASLRFSDDDRALLDQATASLRDVPGDVFELERDSEGPHGRLMRRNLSDV